MMWHVGGGGLVDRNLSALDDLRKKIGLKDVVEFLQFSAPLIADRANQLQSFLENKEWEKAHKCKHQLLSSVHLYGSPRIEKLLSQLDKVETGEMDKNLYQLEIAEEFSQATLAIEEWLRENAPSY